MEAKDRSWPPWSDREDPGEEASSLYLGRRASTEAFPGKEGGAGAPSPVFQAGAREDLPKGEGSGLRVEATEGVERSWRSQ